MKRCTDDDVLKKHAELRQRQNHRPGAFTEFRRQFDQYQRAKRGGKAVPKRVSRPYMEVFRQPRREGKP
jgi:hypothetical protein